MLNLVSILIGLLALVGVVVAFIPFLGLLNWFVIPLAVVGLGIGALSTQSSGRNLNLIVVIVGVLRLMLGGGIF